MKWFYNLRIAVKLLIGFIFVALIAAFIGIMGYYAMNSMRKGEVEISKVRLPSIEALLVISEAQTAVDSAENALLTKELVGAGRKAQHDRITDAFGRVEKAWKKYEPLPQTDEEKVVWNKFVPAWEEWVNDHKTYISMVKEFEKNPTDELYNNMVKQALEINGESFLKAEELINQLIEINRKVAEDSSLEFSKVYNSTLVVLIITIAIGVILAIGLGIFLSNIISRPVKKMVEAANRLAVGDINVSVDESTNDEIGILAKSFEKMIENIRDQALAVEKIAQGDLTVDVKIKSQDDVLGKKLNEMIELNSEILSRINSASEQVASGAKQVSMSSQILSQGSTEQASSIEEITSSMTQVASQTKKNAESANQASQLALTAKENAERGNIQMQQMVKAMAEINDSSSNISKIIKVIDEIAFQTNILALNAAVEAARAGQHGKGFAVVAEEVRNLAARSANAAKETTEMIENSIKKVEVGTSMANETADGLNKIVDGVAKAAGLVTDIAAASSEQATAISQINQAISQVAQVVQTNSATAQEGASASEELSSQADLLKDSVNQFKLKKVKNSNSLDRVLNTDVIRMIEDVMEKKKHYNSENISSLVQQNSSYDQSPSNKKIVLEDKDFGKY
ncbi:MAG: methyl-accepting chemotaxis protein [Bacillota bacterium]